MPNSPFEGALRQHTEHKIYTIKHSYTHLHTHLFAIYILYKPIIQNDYKYFPQQIQPLALWKHQMTPEKKHSFSLKVIQVKYRGSLPFSAL